jgi:hypothetical protein
MGKRGGFRWESSDTRRYNSSIRTCRASSTTPNVSRSSMNADTSACFPAFSTPFLPSPGPPLAPPFSPLPSIWPSPLPAVAANTVAAASACSVCVCVHLCVQVRDKHVHTYIHTNDANLQKRTGSPTPTWQTETHPTGAEDAVNFAVHFLSK